MIDRWIGLVARHAPWVIGLEALVTGLLALFTITHIAINADHKQIISPDLPFQKDAAAFQEHFPSLDDAILVVVDAETPELARSAAATIQEQLAADTDSFHYAIVPGADPFFEQNGLLLLSIEELEDLTDGLARMQPIIADLSRDNSVANLSRLLMQGLQEMDETEAERFAPVLERMGNATVRVYQEYPIAVSWEELIVQGSALDPGSRQIIITEPRLDFDALLPAGPAIEKIRQIAVDSQLDEAHGIEVRITGNPALNQEEMWGIAVDVGLSGMGSFLLVAFVLYLAFRSGRLVGSAAATLLSGLIWTAAFATAAVGQLNLISIAFGVLFIGLGVDFSIHLGMHFQSEVRRHGDPRRALVGALNEVGGSLLICTFTTAIGFYAFVPTDYLGVAELGLISGTGMFVILIQNLTLLPALVLWRWPTEASPAPAATGGGRTLPAALRRHPGLVVTLGFALAAGGMSLAPRASFDSDVVAMRDPDTESVEAFRDLLAQSDTSPWYADVLAPDLASAEELEEELGSLELVSETRTVNDWIPENQEEKLEILADAAFLLDTPVVSGSEQPPPPVAEQIAALRELRDRLEEENLQAYGGALGASIDKLKTELDTFLERVKTDPDPEASLATLQEVLLGNLPDQIARLRRALEAQEFTLEDLPPDLSEQMLSPTGEARIQVLPRDDLGEEGAREAFVDAVRSISPSATGVSVNLLEFGRATSRSLRQALVFALIAIAILLLVLTRSIKEVCLILTPLILAGAWTFGAMALVRMPFNFANVIVLPLLLGIGVDSGVHLVRRSRDLVQSGQDLLGTTTARAVFWSAITTISSFGSLALSRHRGIASMGVVLVVGMLFTLVANLVVLPALIDLVQGRRKPKTQEAT